MSWHQRDLRLPLLPRGFRLVTRDVAEALAGFPPVRVGLLHVFLCHTSARLSINENADPDVPLDLATALDRLAPESSSWRHSAEGPDDMPAHVKAALLGTAVTLPVRDGRLVLGTWQGIWLGEHRDRGEPRRVVLTLQGE
ncbi:MAG: secondary thiamine-phosphate synthase enzyme YjbQ [Planctomycetota bacterium]